MIKAAFSSLSKQNYLSLPTLALFIFSFNLKAQPPQFKTYIYIEAHAKEAIHQMATYGIPASVTLAQAIYESSSGTSELAKKSNNHFGIKCHWQWCGDTIVKHDDTLNECFRKYNSIKDSYADHSIFLSTRSRYAHLFDLPVNDYAGWCHGLKEAGYATSPDYAERLIKIIEDAGLYVLDGYERLPQVIILEEKNTELKHSRYTGKGFSVRDLSLAGVLWLDENDVMIRSLDLIINSPEDPEMVDIASK
jgi:hypothetical protein